MTLKHPKDPSTPSDMSGAEISEHGDEVIDIPPNPAGGQTLVVDLNNPKSYPRPSAALKDAGPVDQIFIRPGVYEDRIFVADKPIRMIGAGRDQVHIFSRRSGTLYLQRVESGRIEGMTFRYIGSDQHSPMNILDSTCTIVGCRAMEGILSGIVIYGSKSRPSLTNNEVCQNRESGIFSFAGAQPYLTTMNALGTIILELPFVMMGPVQTSSKIDVERTC